MVILTHSSNLGIFEWNEIVGQECGCPENIIIGKEGDRGANLLEPLDHLKALVGLVGTMDLDLRKTEFIADLSNVVDASFGSDDDYGSRIASSDGEDATMEVIAVCQCWNDHSDILVGIARSAGKRYRLERPRGNDTDEQAYVTPKAEEC